jgi:hypothetical protein
MGTGSHVGFQISTKNKSGRGPSNEHFWQVWLKSVQRFQRRRFKCEKLTDGRTTTDAYPWQKLTWPIHGLWPGELKTIIWPWGQRSRSHEGHYGMRHNALWSCTHIPNKYYLKNNYLTFRSKIKVPRRSLWYVTHRLMVMHPHTKYHWLSRKTKMLWPEQENTI